MNDPYVQSLLRHVARTPAVLGVYARPPLWTDAALVLVIADGFPGGVATWLAETGEAALVDPGESGCRVITLTGTVIDVAVVFATQPLPSGALQEIFRRDIAGPPVADGPQGAGDSRDLGADAGRFWGHMYTAAMALGRGWPFTAHGELEFCRVHLVDLYRLALAPGDAEVGWVGIEGLQGASALEGAQSWLVAPLQTVEQWRSATRLAAAYESLMLPLAERMGLAYPWPMRNLAFAKLDAVRPDGRKREE